MVYRKYGDVFKRLRLQHQRTLGDFESVGLSKSSLSQFENGKSLISLDKLDIALQEMHVTMNAYFLMINDGASEYFISQFVEIDKASVTKDIEHLKKIYKVNAEYGTEEGYAVSLAARAGYERLPLEDLKVVEEYFRGCVLWSRYELYLLINTAEQININLLIKLVENFFTKEYYYLVQRQEFKHLIARIVVKLTLILIRMNKMEASQKFINYMKKLPTDFELTERLVLMFLEGAYSYKFESQEMGHKIIKRCLRILTDINAVAFRKMMVLEYERLVNEIV